MEGEVMAQSEFSTGSVAGGTVSGGPRRLLQLEGLAVAVVAIGAYFTQTGMSWQVFAWLFLVPDLSFLGYLAGSSVGARAYNLMHSYVGPLVLLAISIKLDLAFATGIALIWIGHIGVDRLFGYGLKYSSAFGHTHLGLIGKARNNAA